MGTVATSSKGRGCTFPAFTNRAGVTSRPMASSNNLAQLPGTARTPTAVKGKKIKATIRKVGVTPWKPHRVKRGVGYAKGSKISRPMSVVKT